MQAVSAALLPAAAPALLRLLHTAAPARSLVAVKKLFKEMEGRHVSWGWQTGQTSLPLHRPHLAAAACLPLHAACPAPACGAPNRPS